MRAGLATIAGKGSVGGVLTFAELTALSRLLVAAEGSRVVDDLVAIKRKNKSDDEPLDRPKQHNEPVDPNGTGLKRRRDTDGAVEVLGEHRGAETVVGVVGALQDFFLVFKGVDGDDGAKDFLAHDPKKRGETSNHRY